MDSGASALAPLLDVEAYHHDYIAHNPFNPYVVVHDLPKLAQLKRQFPQLLK